MIEGPQVERQLDLIRKKYLRLAARKTANEKILYRQVHPEVAYIDVLALEGMAQQPSIAAQRASLDMAISELWEAFREVSGVILDRHHNRGGFDALSLMIAGLFVDSEHVVFSKKVRIQGTNHFKESRLFHVTPRRNNLAEKPLKLLTGPGTASGAEILVMATMQFPQARR